MPLYFWILAFYLHTNIWWQPCSRFKIVKRAYESIEIHKRSQAACQTASRFSTLSLGPDDPGLFIRLCFCAFWATFLFLLEASWNYFETVRPCWRGKILHLSLAEIQVETGLRLAIEVPELDNSHLWYAVVKHTAPGASMHQLVPFLQFWEVQVWPCPGLDLNHFLHSWSLFWLVKIM